MACDEAVDRGGNQIISIHQEAGGAMKLVLSSRNIPDDGFFPPFYRDCPAARRLPFMVSSASNVLWCRIDERGFFLALYCIRRIRPAAGVFRAFGTAEGADGV